MQKIISLATNGNAILREKKCFKGFVDEQFTVIMLVRLAEQLVARLIQTFKLSLQQCSCYVSNNLRACVYKNIFPTLFTCLRDWILPQNDETVKLYHKAIVLLTCICSSKGLIKWPFQHMENES